MSGNICQYVNCNKSKKNFPTLKMFRFPRDETRLDTWTINAGQNIFNLCQLPIGRWYLNMFNFMLTFIISTFNRR